jgi:polygalacturonase
MLKTGRPTAEVMVVDPAAVGMGPIERNRRQFIGVVGGATAGLPGLLPSAIGRPAAARSAPPGSSGGLYDVTRFGALGDGRTPCTDAFQKAIDACGTAGGGLVLVPPGHYFTGAIFLRSRVHLFLSPGATLIASQRPEDFPPVKGRDEGIERTIHAALINGFDLENVAITGAGLIDGQGDSWWKADEVTRKLRVDAKLPREAEHPADAPLKWPRPRVINLVRCKSAQIEGITIKDGACWNIHLVYCQDVVVDSLKTFQQRDARGTDAIVIDSSRQVRIAHCSLSSGSDCVGIKSGYNEDGRRVGLPAEDILITNCHMYHSPSSGLAIGSETSGGIRNVVMSNCVIQDCSSGVQFRSPRGRGNVVERIRISNLVMDRLLKQAVKVSHFFDSIRMEGRYGLNPSIGRRNPETARSRSAPIDGGTPTFRDFEFSGLTLGQIGEVATIEGLPERFITGITFQNIRVAQAKAGLFCTNVADLRIDNCTVGTLDTAAVDARDVQRLEIHRLRCGRPQPSTPVVWLDNVSGAFIHGCDIAAAAGPHFSWLHQEHSQVVLSANNVPA